MHYEIRYACRSHIGRVRSINQDNYICNGLYMNPEEGEVTFPLSGTVTTAATTLFGVFDGMGGEECGEVASLIASQEAAALGEVGDEAVALADYCQRANAKICTYADTHGVSSMGTTAAMMLCGKEQLMLCNIGDSKIFWCAEGQLEQISQDHVAVCAYGTKPPLSQNLGIPPEQLIIEPYLSRGRYHDGDKYLMCSDGLTDMVTLDEIKEIVANHPVEEAVNVLVDRALQNGGKDNVTVVLLEIVGRKQAWLNALNTFFRRKKV